jgi:hypothetical protein
MRDKVCIYDVVLKRWFRFQIRDNRLDVFLTKKRDSVWSALQAGIKPSEIKIADCDPAQITGVTEVAEVTSETGKRMFFYLSPARPVVYERLKGYSDLTVTLPLGDASMRISIVCKDGGVKQLIGLLKEFQKRLGQ